MDEEVDAVAVAVKVLLRTVVTPLLVVVLGHARPVLLEAILCYIAEVAFEGVENDCCLHLFCGVFHVLDALEGSRGNFAFETPGLALALSGPSG